MESKIKAATIKDLKEIQKLNHMLFVKEYAEYNKTLHCNWPLEVEGESYFKKRIVNKDGCALIAHNDNNVIGYLVGALVKTSSYRVLPKSAELENMFVLDSFRGKGIGTMLMNAFNDWCKTKNVKRIKVVASVSNASAIKFYKKNGLSDYALILESII
ncbi:MAG: GNAT family N-acetyltransferase [Patescibacteria group bacterium]